MNSSQSTTDNLQHSLVENSSGPRLPVKITYCITELDPGGAERALFELVTRLDKTKWEPVVISLQSGGEIAHKLRDHHITVHELNSRSTWSFFKTLWKLRRLLKQTQPQILHTYLFHANVLGRIAGWLSGIPYIISGVRVAEKQKKWHLWADGITQPFVSLNICVSKGVQTFCHKAGYMKLAKSTVIPNGVHYETYANASPISRESLGLSEHDFVFLSIGRLSPQKGYIPLLKTLANWQHKPSRFKLLIAGDGEQRDEILRLITQHNLTGCIKLLGRRNDIPKLLATADACLQCSLWEGMPNAILEAMAAGKPIITTDVEGIEELLQKPPTHTSSRAGEKVVADSECDVVAPSGWIYQCGDDPALRDHIVELMNSPKMANTRANNAQSIVREHFTWDNVAKMHTEIYENLLKH